MRARTLSLLVVIPFLTVACSPANDTAATSDSAAGVAATAATATDAGAVREAIDAANTRFLEAVKRGDTTAATANYADDAVVMMHNNESWRGRDAVRKGFAGMLSQMTVKDASFKTDDVTVSGDLAVETGSYDMTLQPKSGKELKDKGRYVAVWKRQADGSWKIIRDISNPEAPPPRS